MTEHTTARGRWVLGEAVQFPVNFLMQVASTTCNQFCPLVSNSKNEFVFAKQGPVSASTAWTNSKQISWRWGVSTNELSAVSWGSFREGIWSEAGASSCSVLSAKPCSRVSKMRFGGTQPEDSQENTAKREVDEWLRQNFFYSYYVEEGGVSACA